MSTFGPFEANVKNGAAGFTQSLALGAGSGTSQTVQVASSINASGMDLLVTMTNNNATGSLTSYVRITTESSTTITATVTDTPLAVAAGATVVRLFAAPVGTYNVAVIVTVTPSTAGQIWFTPGQGGTF